MSKYNAAQIAKGYITWNEATFDQRRRALDMFARDTLTIKAISDSTRITYDSLWSLQSRGRLKELLAERAATQAALGAFMPGVAAAQAAQAAQAASHAVNQAAHVSRETPARETLHLVSRETLPRETPARETPAPVEPAPEPAPEPAYTPTPLPHVADARPEAVPPHGVEHGTMHLNGQSEEAEFVELVEGTRALIVSERTWRWAEELALLVSTDNEMVTPAELVEKMVFTRVWDEIDAAATKEARLEAYFHWMALGEGKHGHK